MIVLVMLFASWQMVQAQVTTASINGRVSGGTETLPGATVKATHVPSGTVFGTTTRPDGSYTVPSMRIGGPYTVEISLMGFQTRTFSDIHLTLGEERTLNVRLVEGITLEGVEITGEQSTVMNANRTGAQTVITSETMNRLPTINRSLSDFTRLTPMNNGGNFAGVSSRFNNVTVDGASFNNSFGLSSALGASGTEPISLEALEQVQVMIAPYDVRNGGFTGGAINSVTRSGTNEFQVTAYTYHKGPALMGYRVKEDIVPVSEFSNRQQGISISGALIPNKLFFFVNGELDRQGSPISWTTKTPGSQVDATVLQDLSDFLQKELNYNPGTFNKDSRETFANRLTVRLDYNLNPKNVLSLKYYYLKSYNEVNPSTSGAPANGRGPNQWSIPYTSCFYRTNNNFNIIIADLNTVINNRMSNMFRVGYSRIRDFRDMDGGFFPQVDILDGNRTRAAGVGTGAAAYTTFGTEANSYNNQLSTDMFQIQNNFTINHGRHEITLGTQSDYRRFENGFAQNYPGAWVFNSVEDFKFNVLATKQWLASNPSMAGFNITNYHGRTDLGWAAGITGIANAGPTGNSTYSQRYSLMDDGAFPFAYVNVFQIGLYAQDRWRVNDQLTLTFGVRMDMPIFTTDLQENERVAGESYRDGMKVDVSKYPNAKPLFSPRVGFNYNPLEDRSLQLRGGTGLFAGTPPYVWLSNQAGNNGILFANLNYGGATREQLGFTGDIYTYPNLARGSGTAPRADISATDPDFKYPNLWKNNLAVDYRFGDGWIATAEFVHSKDLNAIYHDNIGLIPTGQFVKDGSGQNKRPAFDMSGWYSDLPTNDQAATHVVMLRNTNKGYSVFGTFQLQKNFTYGALEGLNVNASYTLGRAMGVTDGTSSVALSAWQFRPAVDPNAQELGFSSGSIDGRILLSAFYTANWSKTASTNIGIVYQRFRPFRYSYTYNGNANGDRMMSNDLIYIPRNFSEVDGHLVATGFGSVQEAWAAMNAFIEQDPYLKTRRGQFAERNGGVAPWANQMDLSLSHDIRIHQPNGRHHTLRFSLDIFNFLNLVNKDWGVQTLPMRGNPGQQFQFLTVTQTPTAANNYTLQYRMDNALSETFRDNVGAASRWAAMFGIRYSF